MTRFFRLAPAFAAAFLAAAPVAAQSTETIRIRNQSGMTLYTLYASPTSNNSWENDLLGSRVLNNGSSVDFTFRNVRNCNYDFRFEFTTGQVVTRVVNICSVGTYTLNR